MKVRGVSVNTNCHRLKINPSLSPSPLKKGEATQTAPTDNTRTVLVPGTLSYFV